MSDNEDGFVILDVTPADHVNIISSLSRVPPTSSANNNNSNEPNEDDEIVITNVASNPHPHPTLPVFNASRNDQSEDIIFTGERPSTPSSEAYGRSLRRLHEVLAATHYHHNRASSQRNSPRQNNPQQPNSQQNSFQRRNPPRNARPRSRNQHHQNASTHRPYGPTQVYQVHDPSSRSRHPRNYTTFPFGGIGPYIIRNFARVSGYDISEEMLRRAQLSSMEDYYNHHNSGSSVSNIKSVDVPENIKANKDTNYTSHVVKDTEYICALCKTELGVGFPKLDDLKNDGNANKYQGISDTDRARSARLYFANCGHVYCGWCVSRFINRKNINKSNVGVQANKPPKSTKRQKTGPGNKKHDCSSKTLDNHFPHTTNLNGKDSNNQDSEDSQPLIHIFIPSKCAVKDCKRQIRSKSFKEFFL